VERERRLCSAESECRRRRNSEEVEPGEEEKK